MVTTDESEVVISGIGGYFPKAKNIEEFANILFNQEKIVDTARWESGIFSTYFSLILKLYFIEKKYLFSVFELFYFETIFWKINLTTIFNKY